jgi:hypothetical protein
MKKKCNRTLQEYIKQKGIGYFIKIMDTQTLFEIWQVHISKL